MEFIIELIVDILFESLSERKIPLWIRRIFALIIIVIVLAFSILGAIIFKDGIENSKAIPIIIGLSAFGIVICGIAAVIKEYRAHKE